MRPVCFLVALFVLSGCDVLDDFHQAREAGANISRLEIQLNDMSRRVDFLEKENQDLKERVYKIREDIPATAVLDPGTKGFDVVHFPGGMMSVSCNDISEYASGSKLFLSITNFMGVTFTGVSVDLTYAPSLLDDDGNLKENSSNLFKQSVEKVNKIEPGSSKIVEMRLPEYKPDQVKILMIKIRYDGIEFIADKKGKK